METNIFKMILGILRLSMGFIFLWAFLDKTFGFGFATAPEKAWLVGGSPTTGFLQFGVHGPFAEFFNSLAGSNLVDWLFMLGLLFVGLSLMLGIFVRLASLIGTIMMILMYLALMQPANNPLIDDHVIYALVMGIIAFGNAGKYFGLGNKWYNSTLVQKYKILT